MPTARTTNVPHGQQSAFGPGALLCPICVDLDGTLVRTDTLVESVLALLIRAPWMIFMLVRWLVQGKSFLKRQVSSRVTIDPATLPYRPEVVAYLQMKRRGGHPIVLATGADQIIAHAVADHLGIFDAVLAGNGRVNLTGTRKRDLLVQQFGLRRFLYLGNSSADLPVWHDAAAAICVGAPRSVVRRVRSSGLPVLEIDRRGGWWNGYLKALRPAHSLRNLLVLLPLAMNTTTVHSDNAFRVGLALAAMSLCAAAGYLITDLVNLQTDRQDPIKRDRPFASGSLDVRIGAFTAPVLFIAALCIGAELGRQALALTFANVVLLVGFNLGLRSIPGVDIVQPVAIYSSQLALGAAGARVPLSPWFMSCVACLILSLSFARKWTESLRLSPENGWPARGSISTDADQNARSAIAAGYAAVLTVSIYLLTGSAARTYHSPAWLWAVAAALFIWLNRLWVLITDRVVPDDLVLFAMKDRFSYVAAGLAILMALLAR